MRYLFSAVILMMAITGMAQDKTVTDLKALQNEPWPTTLLTNTDGRKGLISVLVLHRGIPATGLRVLKKVHWPLIPM
jgi:hypothetical protein